MTVSQSAVIAFLRKDPMFAGRIHHAANRGTVIRTQAFNVEPWCSLWSTRAIMRFAELHGGAEPSVAKVLRAVALIADDSRRAASRLTPDQYLDRQALGRA